MILHPALKLKLDLPLSLEEAAEPLFHLDYKTLRANLKCFIAQGLPYVKEGRRYLLYPSHVRAWRASRCTADAKRAMRQGEFSVSTQK